MATVEPRSIKDTLSATESGGNPNAWRRNKDGREFVGQWQFGEARLRDLGLGVNFTMDQFRRDPELQSRIMDAHVADINKFIDSNDLSRYEGQTIGGVPITRPGMIAMAHLGGSGGMRKFLESGGEYNPSDELGTSLSDYAMSHGGPTIASTPQATSERLRTFALDADNRALSIRSLAEEVAAEALGRRASIPDNIQAGMRAPMPGISLPPNVGPNVMPPSTQLGWGSAVPEGASPFAAQGMPDPIRMGAGQLSFDSPAATPAGFTINPAQTAGQSGYSTGGPASLSTSGTTEEAATEDPERAGFLTRIGRALFGEDEEDPDGRFKTLLGGLGVGLGQMSAGMPVDLQPYFANIAAQKQATIDSEQAAYQQSIENELAYMNADTQRANSQVAQMRLQHDIEQAAREGRPYNPGLSPETIAKYGEMPKFAPFMEVLANPEASQDAKELAMQGFKEGILKEAQAGAAAPDAIADLYTALNAGDTQKVADILRDNPISTEDFKRIADITDPGVALKNARALADANADPELVSQFMKLARLGGGLSEDQFARDNYAAGREYYGTLLGAVGQGRDLSFNVNEMRTKALAQAKAGQTIEGFQEAFMAPFLAGARRVLPPDWSNRLEETVGLNPQQFQELDGLAKFIVLQAARPLMEGQGTVTDQERVALAKSMTDPSMEFEAQLSVLDRLAVLGDIDVAMANYYRNNQSDNFHGNFQDLQADIELESGQIISQLSASRQAWTSFRNADKSDVFRAEWVDENGEMLPPDIAYARLAPRLTPKQYRMAGDAVVDNLWIDATTDTLMRGNQPFRPSSN